MTNDTEPPSSVRQRRWSVGRMVSTFLSVCRNTVLVAWLLVSLVSVSVAATTWAAVQTWKVAQLTYQVGAMAYQHRREMARAMAKAATTISSTLAVRVCKHPPYLAQLEAGRGSSMPE